MQSIESLSNYAQLLLEGAKNAQETIETNLINKLALPPTTPENISRLQLRVSDDLRTISRLIRWLDSREKKDALKSLDANLDIFKSIRNDIQQITRMSQEEETRIRALKDNLHLQYELLENEQGRQRFPHAVQEEARIIQEFKTAKKKYEEPTARTLLFLRNAVTAIEESAMEVTAKNTTPDGGLNPLSYLIAFRKIDIEKIPPWLIVAQIMIIGYFITYIILQARDNQLPFGKERDLR